MAHSMESRQSRLSRISSRTDTEIFDDGKGEKRYVLGWGQDGAWAGVGVWGQGHGKRDGGSYGVMQMV